MRNLFYSIHFIFEHRYQIVVELIHLSYRLNGVTPQHFVLSQRKGLVRTLKTSLQRDVSLISVQAAPHGDLDVLLAINGVSVKAE
jgi:hypothetical protein